MSVRTPINRFFSTYFGADMAARNRNYHTEKTRKKIQATQLVNRLQSYALGQKDCNFGFGDYFKTLDPDMPETKEELKRLLGDAFRAGTSSDGEPIEMKPAQVKAAQTLLDRTLPTMSMSDVVVSDGVEQSIEEKFDSLVEAMGEDAARTAFPDIYAKVKGAMDAPETRQ